MPKVPTLDGNRIKTQTLNISAQNPNAPIEAFGGGQSVNQVNNAVQGLTSQVQKIQEDAEKRADQVAILDADQQLSALETRVLFDKDTGALNAKGKDSFALGETVVPDFQKKAEEIGKGLTSDRQKASFHKIMSERSKHIDRQIGQHVSREAVKYDEQVTKSYVANEMNAAIESFHDPERIKLSLDRQRGAILSHIERNGLDEETGKLLLAETTSKTHSAVVSKILNAGGTREAQSYYSSNKDNILGEDRIRVEKSLKQGILMADSQDAADSIVRKFDNSKDALDKARQIDDPDKRDEVVRRVKSTFADRAFARKADQDAAFETAYRAIESNPSMDAIPKQILAEMSLSDRKALEKRAAQLKNGLAVESDIVKKYELDIMSGNPATRNEFAQLNLLKVSHLLSRDDFDKFSKAQNSIRSGKTPRELDGLENKNSIISNALGQAGIRSGKAANTEDLKQAALFRRKVDQLVIDDQEATGKKVTNERLRQITDRLLIDTYESKGFFGFGRGEKKLFERTSDENFMIDTKKISLQSIPGDDLEKIKAVLIKKNKPVTDENIKALYLRKLNAGGDNG